jgi:ribonuclease PH
MRRDGRAADALRPIHIERGYTKHAPGSVLVSFGDTKVICTATFEEQLPAWRKDSGKGWVTAEYAMLPGSSAQRVKREAQQRGRAQEIGRLIGRSLRAVTDFDALGKCLVTIDCDVIQADGGTRTAAITGAYVALHDALGKSVERGFIKAIPLVAQCAAVSVGMVDGVPMLDLNYGEDSTAHVDMNIVMDGGGRYIEVQGAAEGRTFSRAELDAMLSLSEKGVRELLAIQRKVLDLG